MPRKCKEQYIGETEKPLAVRFRQHRGYIRNREIEKSTGQHFNKPGHTMADMKITIFEKSHLKTHLEKSERAFSFSSKNSTRNTDA